MTLLRIPRRAAHGVALSALLVGLVLLLGLALTGCVEPRHVDRRPRAELHPRFSEPVGSESVHQALRSGYNHGITVQRIGDIGEFEAAWIVRGWRGHECLVLYHSRWSQHGGPAMHCAELPPLPAEATADPGGGR